jgi:hypothetical protein
MMMKVRQYGYALALICSFAPPVTAQQWLSQLPPNVREQPTINDLRQAFESYYREHPIDLTRDQLQPIFRFEAAQEQKERLDIEEYKMFRRWEWLVEPRAYPSGRLDLEQIATFGSQVREKELIPKQPTESPLAKLQLKRLWEPLGPSDAVGGANLGRVTCIEFDPNNVKTIYLCGADGGVWKSTDDGTRWSPIFDFQPTLSVGDIAIDRKNTNVFYVATSDPFGYGVPFWGGTYSIGIMKSTDGGATWSHTGFNWTVSQNRTIRRLVMHPTYSNILLAATSAGLYRTADGGANWTRILPASTYDVEFQQDDGAIVYATTNQVLKSSDAGASFHLLGASCAGSRYNVKIAVSNPMTLYTLPEVRRLVRLCSCYAMLSLEKTPSKAASVTI